MKSLTQLMFCLLKYILCKRFQEKKKKKKQLSLPKSMNKNLRGELLSSSIRKYLDKIHIPKQPLNVLCFFFLLACLLFLNSTETDDVSNRKLRISKHVFERRPSTGSGLFSFLDSC